MADKQGYTTLDSKYLRKFPINFPHMGNCPLRTIRWSAQEDQIDLLGSGHRVSHTLIIFLSGICCAVRSVFLGDIRQVARGACPEHSWWVASTHSKIFPLLWRGRKKGWGRIACGLSTARAYADLVGAAPEDFSFFTTIRNESEIPTNLFIPSSPHRWFFQLPRSTFQQTARSLHPVHGRALIQR